MSVTAFTPTIWKEAVPVDLKATGATIIVPAESGKKLVVIRAWIDITTNTAAAGSPTVSLGTNSTAFNNLGLAQSVGLATGEYRADLLLNASSKVPTLDIGSNGLRFNVSVAATGTALSGVVHVEGYKR